MFCFPKPPEGFQKVIHTLHGHDANINSGNSTAKCYLCFKRGDGPPIYDLQVLNRRKKERNTNNFFFQRKFFL